MKSDITSFHFINLKDATLFQFPFLWHWFYFISTRIQHKIISNATGRYSQGWRDIRNFRDRRRDEIFVFLGNWFYWMYWTQFLFLEFSRQEITQLQRGTSTLGVFFFRRLPTLTMSLFGQEYTNALGHHHNHHHVQKGLVLIPVPCILKMKLLPPSLPLSSYVSSSFWFIL
jgi:hypothetical protein